MKQYLDLLRHVRDHGVRKPTRAILLSTGEKIDALSVFGYQMRFDLNDGFPAVTTKKLAFSAVVHELLWFLSGSTKVGDLQKHNVSIWDEWADENGDVGPIYGKQWRAWDTPNGPPIDQVAYLRSAGRGTAPSVPSGTLARSCCRGRGRRTRTATRPPSRRVAARRLPDDPRAAGRRTSTSGSPWPAGSRDGGSPRPRSPWPTCRRSGGSGRLRRLGRAPTRLGSPPAGRPP
jgi:Thymidylate synthase